jgi:hypothetical protein
MFRLWSKSKAPALQALAAQIQSQLPVAVAEPPKPELLETELNFDEFSEYEKVATELGISNHGATLAERLRQFFKTEGICVYKNREVVQFLNKKLGKWQWAGLRESDVEHLKGWHSKVGDTRIDFSWKQYTAAVPLPVLYTVKKIAAAFPDVHFYVSEKIGDDLDDPFLAATTRSMRLFIVERWDEPDYRER